MLQSGISRFRSTAPSSVLVHPLLRNAAAPSRPTMAASSKTRSFAGLGKIVVKMRDGGLRFDGGFSEPNKGVWFFSASYRSSSSSSEQVYRSRDVWWWPFSALVPVLNMVEESEPPNSDEGDDLSRIAEKSTTHGLVFSDAAAPRYDSPEDFPLIYPTSCPMNPKAWWCKHCPPTVEFHSFCPAEAHRCKTGHEVLPLIVVEQYWLFGDRETCSRECEKMVRPNPEEIVQHCIEKGHRITRVVWVRNTKNGEDYQVVKTLEPEYYRMVELPRMDAPPHIKEHATCLCRAI